MSEETPRSPQSRARTRGPIAAILASAREEVNGSAPAPSLEFPSRPKTPASYDDDKVSINSNLNIFNMKSTVRSSAGSKNSLSALANKRQSRSSRSRSAVDNSDTTEPTQVVKPSVASTSITMPLSRIVESGFNPEQLLNDLSFVLESDTMEFNTTLSEKVEAFIKFLQPLQSDADLSSGMISAIEDIIFKLSGIALTMLQNADSDPLQVLSVLRLNLRILVRLFDTSTSLTESTNKGLFDLQQVAMVMNQCTQALYQLCAMHYVPDIHGTSTLQLVSLLSSSSTEIEPQNAYEGDIYQDLDDCDIEMEDGDGTYVPLRPTTASNSNKANTHTNGVAMAQTNGDIAGVPYLNQLMSRLFPTVQEIHDFLHQHRHDHHLDTTDQVSVFVTLLESATHICGVYKLLSVSEIDCKWLNSAETLEPLLNGLKRFDPQLKVNLTAFMFKTPELANVVVNCVTTMLAVVRNCSEVKSCRQVLLDQKLAPVLCSLLKAFSNHSKVVVNCSRVLAKLSTSDACRQQINRQDQSIQNLVDLVLREARGGSSGEGEWPGQHTWTILTRVCFILGNLTTSDSKSSERNRKLISTFGLTGVADTNKDDPLVDLLASCGMALSSMFESDHDDQASDDGASEQNTSADSEEVDEGDNGDDADSRSAERELVDATVKLVRLLANLSMDPEIGRVLGSKNHNALEMLVKMLVSVREGGSAGQEELLLNVIAACTNLTFYSSKYIIEANASRASPTNGAHFKPSTATPKTTADRLLDLSSQLSIHLVTCLTTHPNSEIQLESARVLGNLTRIESIRRALLHTYGPELLIDLLKHPQWDVVSAVTGILVNLSADVECKQILLQQEGSKSVLMALSWELRKIGLQDPDISTLMCQALYNLLLTTPSVPSTAPAHIQDRLHATLDKLINQGMDETEAAGEPIYAQFLKVGITLMKLIAKQRE